MSKRDAQSSRERWFTSRRDLLQAGLGAITLTISGCSVGSNTAAFTEGFESGMDGWSTGAAIGPEVPLEEFDWTVEVSGDEAADGTRSLRIWNEGDYDDGTTWVVHPVSIRPDRAYDVTVSAQFWSESESFNTLRDAVMRLGPQRPGSEGDFPHPGLNTTDLGETPYEGLREPLWLVDGWREYSFEWTTPTLGTDTLYLALGTSVIWEGDATHFIDDVAVRMKPR